MIFFYFKRSYFILRCTASDVGFFSVYVLSNIRNFGYHPKRLITVNCKSKHKSDRARMKESEQRSDFVLMFLHYALGHNLPTYFHGHGQPTRETVLRNLEQEGSLH